MGSLGKFGTVAKMNMNVRAIGSVAVGLLLLMALVALVSKNQPTTDQGTSATQLSWLSSKWDKAKSDVSSDVSKVKSDADSLGDDIKNDADKVGSAIKSDVEK